MDTKHLKYITAPMVNQSDLPFRLLAERYGATMSYTQMLIPDRLLNDQNYLEFHLHDLTLLGNHREKPVIVQLCGNDPRLVVEAGRKLQSYCDGIGMHAVVLVADLNPVSLGAVKKLIYESPLLPSKAHENSPALVSKKWNRKRLISIASFIDLNLGCPQEAARDGHYGSYLLGQKDWPLVENIISSLSSSLAVPISAKLRLCQPTIKTLELGERLEAQGASWITLHARTVSARRRRHGPADLSVVRDLKSRLRIPVISNGNVHAFADLQSNFEMTGADGLMVGETLLGNPCLFASDAVQSPFDISLEYLGLCSQFPGAATIPTIQTHIRHFVEFQHHRQTWFPKFWSALAATKTVDEIEHLVARYQAVWEKNAPRNVHQGHGVDEVYDDQEDKPGLSNDDDIPDISLIY